MKQVISAEAWLVNNKIYLRAYSQTVMGISLARNNPIYILTHDQFDNLGHTILKTLQDAKWMFHILTLCKNSQKMRC